jgi:hypothetical protein
LLGITITLGKSPKYDGKFTQTLRQFHEGGNDLIICFKEVELPFPHPVIPNRNLINFKILIASACSFQSAFFNHKHSCGILTVISTCLHKQFMFLLFGLTLYAYLQLLLFNLCYS